MKSEELRDLGAIGGVFMYTKLQALAEGLVEPRKKRCKKHGGTENDEDLYIYSFFGKQERFGTSTNKSRSEKLLVIILLLGNFCEHLQALLHQVLLDHSQDLVLLQGLARDVQWKIFGVDHTFHLVKAHAASLNNKKYKNMFKVHS